MPKPIKKPPVCKEDLANLRESGLTFSTIRANGLYTELDPAKLSGILNLSHAKPYCKGGLVFPYRDLDGNTNGLFHRDRLLGVVWCM